MENLKIKNHRRDARKARIRSRISGTAEMPRVTVYRSNKYFYAQAIDDVKGNTLAAVKTAANYNLEVTKKAGEEFGKALKTKKINKFVFDRNGYMFHGNIAAFVEGIKSIINA